MAPLKILHLVNSLGSGGAERFVTDLARAQAANGHSVRVLTLSDASDLGDRSGLDAIRRAALIEAGIPTLTIGHSARKWLLPAVWSLRRSLRKEPPDLVHCHLLTGLLLLTLSGSRVPIVATHHNTPLPASPWIFRLIARRARAFVTISRAAEPILARCYDGPRPLIYNGISEGAAGSAEKDKGGPLRILSLGNLKASKNYPHLVDVAAQLRDRGVDAQFSIAGEGAERRAIQARIDTLDVDDRVRLLGARGDGEALLASSDLYLATSRWEGMPIALIEALQASLPIVASDVGGCGEVIGTDQSCGFLVPPDDTDAFADRITELAGDPALRARMGEAARRRAGFFSIARAADAYDAVYRSALG